MKLVAGENYAQSESTTSLGFDVLASALDAERRRLSIPGAVVHLSTPELGSWTQSFGVADIETSTPMTNDSIMRVGSVTKMIVATIALQLVEAGGFHLDDTVHSILPELSIDPAVTVKQLLNMTSGLPDYTSDEFVDALLAAPSRVWTPEGLLEVAFESEQHFAAGTAFEYCNTNYIILGLLIEHLTGTDIADIAQTTIFGPLGMNSTALPPLTDKATKLGSADLRGYHRHNDEFIDATDVNPSWAWTAGNAVSTADDLSVFVGALVRGDLLTASLQRERLRSVPVIDNVRYGLGIADFDGMWGHNGELPGFQSFAGHDPTTSTTLVVLTNVDDKSADQLATFLRSQLDSPH
ncbi:D-alanyl-D-alanine carboxypeptidase [Rhodococcus sp. OAS809]|jgi:D-alanyl-D-alanine carboxypeptidase|uniref:serine hydrolase domain-containing protein n=1 Tax=Rhodococcus TaxID=1827 RepID=UPI0017891425|nr:serine hydrolase domain-containing protein [Rhodococcus qingshengii]MDT9664863.1 serine hydrolase domain-containing protein [Rhodococcus qingshengii]